MAGKKININFDPIIKYFKNLSTDMIIAYFALALGVVLIIVGLVLI